MEKKILLKKIYIIIYKAYNMDALENDIQYIALDLETAMELLQTIYIRNKDNKNPDLVFKVVEDGRVIENNYGRYYIDSESILAEIEGEELIQTNGIEF